MAAAANAAKVPNRVSLAVCEGCALVHDVHGIDFGPDGFGTPGGVEFVGYDYDFDPYFEVESWCDVCDDVGDGDVMLLTVPSDYRLLAPEWNGYGR